MISSILHVLSLRLPVLGGVERQEFRLEDAIRADITSQKSVGRKEKQELEAKPLPSLLHSLIHSKIHEKSTYQISEPGVENTKGWGSLRKKGT